MSLIICYYEDRSEFMKKQNLLGILCLGLTIIIVVGSIFYKQKEEKEEESTISLSAKKLSDCNAKRIYANLDGYDLYSYCLEDINVNYEEKKDIVFYLQNNNLLKIVEKWDKKILDNNNGTLYYNNDYKIVKCNLDDNKNLYIGTSEMPIDNLCAKNDKGLTFRRTYQVLNITDSDTEEYWHLTLKEYQVDNVVTVKVKKEINPNLKEKRSYVFEFAYNGTCITDELKWILENAEIVSIKQTDKVGMDAIRDEVNTCN